MKNHYELLYESKRKSLIYSLLGEDIYSIFEECPKRTLLISTLFICAIFALSFVCRLKLLCVLVTFCSGLSPIFIAYLLAVVVSIDKRQKTIEIDDKKSLKNVFFVAKGIILLILGLSAIFYSFKVRWHYNFECRDYIVDMMTGYYHYIDVSCPSALNSEDLYMMSGYEIEQSGFEICPYCREYMYNAASSLF